MRQATRGALLGVLGTLAVLTAAAAAFVFSGVYDVAASRAHAGLVRGVLQTVQQQSIERHAPEAVELPTDSAAWLHGLEHYRAMCEICHGGPGVRRGELGRGLTPRPPELGEAATEFTDGELVWIIRHGIKFTGMPAFGETHSDEEIRQIAVFVRSLPEIEPEEYARLVAALPENGHAHGPGAGHPDRAAQPGDAAEASGTDSGHRHAPGTPAHPH